VAARRLSIMSVLAAILAGFAAAGGALVWAGNRHAPLGYEDDDGFHSLNCGSCDRFKKCGPEQRCVLGYPTRVGFFQAPGGARPGH
jgi:hypothetical protein